MTTHLATQLYESHPGAADSRSSFLYALESPDDDLQTLTSELANVQPEIGYPSLQVTSAEDMAVCGVTMNDHSSWQLLFRKDHEHAYTVQGDVTVADKIVWAIARGDHQGKWMKQGEIHDPEDKIGEFVLQSIASSGLINIVPDIRSLRAHKQKQFEKSRIANPASNTYYGVDKKVDKLRSEYLDVKLTPGVVFRTTERSIEHEYPQILFTELPAWVRKTILTVPSAELKIPRTVISDIEKRKQMTALRNLLQGQAELQTS